MNTKTSKWFLRIVEDFSDHPTSFGYKAEEIGGTISINGYGFNTEELAIMDFLSTKSRENASTKRRENMSATIEKQVLLKVDELLCDEEHWLKDRL